MPYSDMQQLCNHWIPRLCTSSHAFLWANCSCLINQIIKPCWYLGRPHGEIGWINILRALSYIRLKDKIHQLHSVYILFYSKTFKEDHQSAWKCSNTIENFDKCFTNLKFVCWLNNDNIYWFKRPDIANWTPYSGRFLHRETLRVWSGQIDPWRVGFPFYQPELAISFVS